ncbi:hexosaminidase [Amycolatopsis marina]|uniref:beta-N-acetylhexosaminidase n=1 Tax=Amycolatopsis marina TaxID=490629 RepID=A0A1I0WNQ0_9PSEU|nr:beta-N-acetylhexosaminidase [Amycolatopsis marina]SFA89623.1 hexosaminidase [Amycolatopsis marina]
MTDPARYALIPEPTHLTPRAASFRIAGETTVFIAPGAETAGRALERAIGPSLPGNAQDADIRISIVPEGQGTNGYRLDISTDRIDILGTDATGAFYGVQTLRQLLPPDSEAPERPGRTLTVPCVQIEDFPRFAWRGLMLDVARHFMPVDFLRRVIDVLSLHKLDVLHLHLTDDQGWRIEVPGYPRLTEVSAWRTETVIGHDSAVPTWDLRYDGRSHGGFYSTAELSDLVAYAEERHVTIIPEVDMPGHMQAAIAAYPDLGNGIAEPEVRRRWNISTQILSLNEPAMRFCRDVLTEVTRIFPSEFIHCGGDEVPTDEWRMSPQVQQRIKDLGLPDETALQGWFTRQIAAFLDEHGRRLVGWDEVLDARPLPANCVVMPWRGDTAVRNALNAGVDVVMTPAQHLYLNYNQSTDVHAEPLAIGGFVPLSMVHAYTPGRFGDRVLGAQAQLWTEYIDSPELAEYMLFPRLCAFAEAVWRQGTSPDAPDFARFLERLRPHLSRLDALGVRYRPLDAKPD